MGAEHITLGAMAPIAERSLFGPPQWCEMDTESNATATATHAGVAGMVHQCYKVVVSYSGTVAAAVELDIKDGSTVIARFQIPAAATAPVPIDFGLRPLRATAGADIVATVGAGGSGITGTVWMYGDSIRSA